MVLGKGKNIWKWPSRPPPPTSLLKKEMEVRLLEELEAKWMKHSIGKGKGEETQTQTGKMVPVTEDIHIQESEFSFEKGGALWSMQSQEF